MTRFLQPAEAGPFSSDAVCLPQTSTHTIWTLVEPFVGGAPFPVAGVSLSLVPVEKEHSS